MSTHVAIGVSRYGLGGKSPQIPLPIELTKALILVAGDGYIMP